MKRFSATVKSSTQPESWRSSGITATPAAAIAPGLARSRSRGRRPRRGRRRARRRLDSTSPRHALAVALDAGEADDLAAGDVDREAVEQHPAVSRPRTVASTMRSTGGAVAALGAVVGRRPSRRRGAARGRRRSARRAARPRARPWPGPARRRRCSPSARVSTTRPSRMIVISSVAASTSGSLWLTSATALPSSSTTWRSASNRNSDSSGVSTEVGSSKTSTCGSRRRHLMISTRWRMPAGRSAMRWSGSICRPYCSLISPTRCAHRAGSKRPTSPSATFSHTVSASTRLKCWWTMRDAVLGGVDRVVDPHRFAVEADLAGVGQDEPDQDLHQRRLAGAVLPEDAVDPPTVRGVRSTRSQATTRPKRLVMPISSTAGGEWRPPPRSRPVVIGVTSAFGEGLRVDRSELLGELAGGDLGVHLVHRLLLLRGRDRRSRRPARGRRRP